MQRRSEKANLPIVVEHFEKLPPEARIDSSALRILLGINSYATFSRRRKDGSIPAPDCPHSTWSVRVVRKLLEVDEYPCVGTNVMGVQVAHKAEK